MTGASDGIGKEFALQLAGRGFNVLLVARNTALLEAAAEEISASVISSKKMKVTVHRDQVPGYKDSCAYDRLFGG